MHFKIMLLAGVAAFGAVCPAFASSKLLGSANVALIDPPVAHPSETPCVVNLYQKAVFGASNANFTYTPPAGCPGPYATIVLSVDVRLNAGIQYDRTGTIWVGGVPLWFGTTAEPAPNQAPSWHFERDVTDYTSLLASAQSGYALIANYTNSTDTSVITSSAQLLFYPVVAGTAAPRVPDMVIPVAAAGGGTVALNKSSSVLNITPALPTNIVAAKMDLYLQGQSGDEFWYTCVPDALAGELESCGGGSVREGEIAVDGVPAGVAPVSPWIFTGGIDPFLWSPIPGVQTLDFKPFRVELSPFAGVLSNGAAHTLSLSVFGANSYFSVAGALLLYLDPNSTQVTGSVTQNTLTAQPVVKTTNTISTDAKGNINGGVNTSEDREFAITGTVVTSAGSVTYQLQQSINFTNDQKFKITATGSDYVQAIDQDTLTNVTLMTKAPDGTSSTQTTSHVTPLNVTINYAVAADGSAKQATTIGQVFADTARLAIGGVVNSQSAVTSGIETHDVLDFDSEGNFTGNTGQGSIAGYLATSTGLPCYGRKLVSSFGVLRADTVTCK